MIFDGLTLAEYLAPRMKAEKQKKDNFLSKKSAVESYYAENNTKPVVCAMVAGCSECWARRVIREYKKAAVG